MILDLPSNKWCIVLHLRVYCAQAESVVATTADLHQTLLFSLSPLQVEDYLHCVVCHLGPAVPSPDMSAHDFIVI